MKRKGFAFNKGPARALNYGYYRLLPMKTSRLERADHRVLRPGIVELSRLTTGKANKEIEEIAAFLIATATSSEGAAVLRAARARRRRRSTHAARARVLRVLDAQRTPRQRGHRRLDGAAAGALERAGDEGQPLSASRPAWALHRPSPRHPGRELVGTRLIGTWR
jgi:hypothetical protein